MNKAEMVAKLAERAGTSKNKASDILNNVFEIITEELKKDGDFPIAGLGRFYVKERPARKGRNPHTGKAMDLPAKKLPAFRLFAAGKKLLG